MGKRLAVQFFSGSRGSGFSKIFHKPRRTGHSLLIKVPLKTISLPFPLPSLPQFPLLPFLPQLPT
ncbi:unnamed protein product [Meloidogyne enterolobii]|uniref:Uncharacterized protein n=1 Tax=Meloidogyne enterolobii TaxID=390850 RepID=A0ACB0ZMA3_MELEN